MTTILLVPGLGCDETYLESFGSLLAPYGSVVICRFPKSNVEIKGGVSGLINVALLEAEALIKESEDLIIVGHSFGSSVALKLADSNRKRVRSLVLFEGNLTKDDCGLLSSKLLDLDTEKGIRGFVEKQGVSSSVGMRTWSEMAAMFAPMVLRCYAKELVEISESGELLDIFSSLTCKKLYVFGDEYFGHPTLSKLNLDCKFYLEGTSHFNLFETPKRCFEVIKPYL